MWCFLHREVLHVPGLLQGSAAVMKAMPRTPCIATCVCALTGDTVKGEWKLPVHSKLASCWAQLLSS